MTAPGLVLQCAALASHELGTERRAGDCSTHCRAVKPSIPEEWK